MATSTADPSKNVPRIATVATQHGGLLMPFRISARLLICRVLRLQQRLIRSPSGSSYLNIIPNAPPTLPEGRHGTGDCDDCCRHVPHLHVREGQVLPYSLSLASLKSFHSFRVLIHIQTLSPPAFRIFLSSQRPPPGRTPLCRLCACAIAPFIG